MESFTGLFFLYPETHPLFDTDLNTEHEIELFFDVEDEYDFFGETKIGKAVTFNHADNNDLFYDIMKNHGFKNEIKFIDEMNGYKFGELVDEINNHTESTLDYW